MENWPWSSCCLLFHSFPLQAAAETWFFKFFRKKDEDNKDRGKATKVCTRGPSNKGYINKEQHVPIAEIKWLHKHSFSPEDVDAKSSILTALWNANPQAMQTCRLGLRVDVVAVCCS